MTHVWLVLALGVVIAKVLVLLVELLLARTYTSTASSPPQAQSTSDVRAFYAKLVQSDAFLQDIVSTDQFKVAPALQSPVTIY